MQPKRYTSALFTPSEQIDIRQLIALAMLLMAFLASLFFYGTGVNLVVLLGVVGSLMVSVSVLWPEELLHGFLRNRGFWAALIALGYLGISYNWSISQDSSFAPTFVIAALPLVFIIAISLGPDVREFLISATTAIVLLFAVISVVQFLMSGERAHKPLADPNNYATLLYLCWIPLVHRHISRCWLDPRGGSLLKRRLFDWVLIPSLIFLIAIFATYSRAAAVIVTVSFFVWVCIGMVRGYSLLPILVHAAAAVFAYIFVTVASPVGIENVAQVGAVSQGLEERLALIQSALQMLKQSPLLGIGIFCFPLLYPVYRSNLDQDTAGFFVHNDYIQFLVEGGIPLLALLLAFVVWMIVRFLRLVSGKPIVLEKAGPALAVCAAAAHATINFVFYSLPLTILIGILAAVSLTRETDSPAQAKKTRTLQNNGLFAVRAALLAGLLFGWGSFGYLLLDTAIYGVFQGQRGLPLVAAIRRDPQRAIEFSRFAQKLNADRGVPVLAEALLTAHQSELEPDSDFLRERALAKFRQAREVDPWNPQVYLDFSRFLASKDQSRLRLREDEDQLNMLLKAISLDPLFEPALEQLLVEFETQGEYQKRYLLLRRIVYPWMTLLKRRDPETANRYMAELKHYAEVSQDLEFQSELAVQEKLMENVRPAEQHRVSLF